MYSIFLNYVLPIFGIVILLLCFGSFVFPYGDRFKGKIQKVKAFGLDLEVSVIAFFVIVGVIFSLTGAYFQQKNYEKKIADTEEALANKDRELKEKEKDLNKKIELEIKPSILLENIDADSKPELENLICSYQISGKWDSVRVEKGVFRLDYAIVLEDITPSDHIEFLKVEDSLTGRMWVKEIGSILTPKYSLREED